MLFVHDCLAACGDGKTRLLVGRIYPLTLPPWSIASRDPLTIDPSIDCGACAVHGWIRDGAWVNA